MAWSPERTNTGSKPSWRRTIPSISPSDGSSSTTRTLPFTQNRPLPSTDNRPRMPRRRPTRETLGFPQGYATPLTAPGGVVTMRASADERKAVSSPPPPWEPPDQPSGQPGTGPPPVPPPGPPPASGAEGTPPGAPDWAPPGAPGAPGWGPPPGAPGAPAWGPPSGAPGWGPP